MPRVEIDTPGVTIRLDATEASVSDLARQALELYRDACAVEVQVKPGPALGFASERRWAYDAHELGNGHATMTPVQA